MSSVTYNKEDQDKKTNIVLLLDFKVFKYSDIHDCSPFRDVCEYMFEYFGYRSVSRRLLALFRPVYTEHASVMFFFCHTKPLFFCFNKRFNTHRLH